MRFVNDPGCQPDSAVRQPEQLFREKKLTAAVLAASAACTLLLFFGLPDVRACFEPWNPAPE